jgi:hypothetical protein
MPPLLKMSIGQGAKSMKRMFRAAAAVAATLAVGATLGATAGANAATITFADALGGLFGGAEHVTESGYTYSASSGMLYVNVWGNPEHDMEGHGNSQSGGVLTIVSAGSNPDFTFAGLDYSAYGGTGTQTLTVNGYDGATLVGTDTYTLTNTTGFIPAYDNWTTEAASDLSGKTLTSLEIVLDGATSQYKSVDNIVLNPAVAAVPEPATWAMLTLGVAMIGLAARRRRAGMAVAA